MHKKVYLFLICVLFLYILNGISLENTINLALRNNSEINSSIKEYERKGLALKFLDGSYSPEIKFSSSSDFPDDYEWKDCPDNFSSTISCYQPLPGGTSISVDTIYSFYSNKLEDENYLGQNGNISVSLSQSLLPFWLQGTIRDPVKLSLKQQKEYALFQVQLSKKTIMEKLVQAYIYALCSNNEILMCQNSIKLYEDQIDAYKQLINNGSSSQAKVLEIENLKWNSQQALFTKKANLAGYLQTIKTVCGQNIDEELNPFIPENIDEIMINNLGFSEDPLEQIYKMKIEMLISSRIIERQNTAPSITMSLQPQWTFPVKKAEEWKSSWEETDKPSEWTANILFNLSPLISGTLKQNKKKFKVNHIEAKELYSAYLRQRDFLSEQYQSLKEYYMKQSQIISDLCQSSEKEFNDYCNQYKEGRVSKIDIESFEVSLKNSQLLRENMELYSRLYSILLILN